MQIATSGNKGRKLHYRRLSPTSGSSKSSKALTATLTSSQREILNLIQNNQVLKRYVLYKDIMDALKVDGYFKAAITTVTNAGVGADWAVEKHKNHFLEASDENKEKLLAFYGYSSPDWNNIKDFYGMPSKLVAALFYLKFFGQAAFQIVKNQAGEPLGFEYIYGFVIPNVDEEGYFKDPAFIHLSLDTGKELASYSSDEVVFIVSPDLTGRPWGDALVESLTNFPLPLDIYLQTAAIQYLQESKLPPAIWELPEKVDEEEFNALADYIEDNYKGANNIGKVPIVVSGEINIKRLASFPDQIPYMEARNGTRQEILSVVGTMANKLGIDTENELSEDYRKEFFESTVIPLFRFIEEGLYTQVHKRLFEIDDWVFKFGRVDFLDDVEQATVHMRYRQIGVMNANEIRAERGLPPREDGKGGDFTDPITNNQSEEQGSPPEGREDRPDSPSEVGEPTIDDQDPPRGDRRLFELELINELAALQRFVLNRWSSRREDYVEFFWNHEDAKTMKAVQQILSKSETKDEFIESMEELRRHLYVGT